MMGWGDVYKVVEALAPLFFALTLGFGSVKWWGIFSKEDTKIINKFVSYLALPILTFSFTSKINPFNLNFHFFAADAISKLLILFFMALCETYFTKRTYDFSINTFSNSSLISSLLVGVPLVNAMYGQMGVNLIVQGSVIQALAWLTVLLFVSELRQMGSDFPIAIENSSFDESSWKAQKMMDDWKKDLEGEAMKVEKLRSNISHINKLLLIKALMKKVFLNLVTNPNSCSCIIGFAWALVAKRWDIQMPNFVENSIGIMSKMGIATTLFNMGMFMALKENWIACGGRQSILGMVLKFIGAPAAMAIASIGIGLHGHVLAAAIFQAAIQQPITLSIYANEYELHQDVISTS